MPKPQAAAPPPAPAMDVLVSLIRESSTNPRKAFDKDREAELVQSVRTQGVLQPVLVRPCPPAPDPRGAGGAAVYELVYGHRRLRAAKKAGLDRIPAQVRELSDLEVIEIQAVENQQREDVHPLEEADAYRLLHATHGIAVAEIAKRVGKSPTYIYGRLKLCDLGDAARKAFLAGKIGAEVAYLLARVPNHDLQGRALGDMLEDALDEDSGAQVSPREAARLIQDRYMLRMAGATFDPKDAQLVAAAGSCAECPKRTGNARELFPDVGKDDLCTDPGCWRMKSDKAFAQAAAAAEQRGEAVMPDKEAAKLFPYGDRLVGRGKFIDLQATAWEDEKNRTYGQILGKRHGAKVTIARDQQGGVHRLVEATEARRLLAKQGVRERGAAQRTSDKAARRKAEAHRAWVQAVLAALVEAAHKVQPEAIYRTLLACFEEQGYSDAFKQVAARREIKVKTAAERRASRTGWKGAPPGDLAGLVLEVAVARNAYWAYATGLDDTVRLAAKELGVDCEAIKRRVAKEREAAEKAQPRRAKKKGGR